MAKAFRVAHVCSRCRSFHKGPQRDPLIGRSQARAEIAANSCRFNAIPNASIMRTDAARGQV